MKGVDLTAKLKEWLPESLWELLVEAGQKADETGQSLYLVGGSVRDLLLERPNLDLDLVIEGDPRPLAEYLGQTLAAPRVAHERFGTFKFQKGDFCLDLATARSETYAHPGALPTVTPGSIQDDLKRRDFTINAMVLRLVPSAFGQLLDPLGGQSDLESKLVRILHPGSFRDDATRILRALRYEQRLGFRLEAKTERRLRRDVAMLRTVSGDRLRHELELILSEDYPERMIARAAELGVLPELHPSLRGNGTLAESFQALRQSAGCPSDPTLYLALLAYPLTEAEGEEFLERLNFPAESAKVVRDTLRLKAKLPLLASPNLPPSQVYFLLEPFSLKALEAVALVCPEPARRYLNLYKKSLRYVKTILKGDDLKKLGLPSGPLLGKALRALKAARLDQQVSTRPQEEAFVRRWIKENLRHTD